jgi:hypothetical protein
MYVVICVYSISSSTGCIWWRRAQGPLEPLHAKDHHKQHQLALRLVHSWCLLPGLVPLTANHILHLSFEACSGESLDLSLLLHTRSPPGIWSYMNSYSCGESDILRPEDRQLRALCPCCLTIRGAKFLPSSVVVNSLMDHARP